MFRKLTHLSEREEIGRNRGKPEADVEESTLVKGFPQQGQEQRTRWVCEFVALPMGLPMAEMNRSGGQGNINLWGIQ